jgi:hypothetical protein
MAAWDLMDKTAKQLAETAPQFPTMEEIIDAKANKDYIIIDVNWSYGMNKSKESSEIVIIG